MNEHRAAFYSMLKTILRWIDCAILEEWQIDKMDGVREFNFNGYCTKWVYSPVNGKTYMTLAIPTDDILWANVIGKIDRYALTGEI